MPSIDWNKRIWTNALSKHQADGDRHHFDMRWGEPTEHWWSVQVIRHRVNPKSHVLEIGPGIGRFTFFATNASSITLVDVCPSILRHLQPQITRQCANVRCHLSSGSDLSTVERNSIDFVFSLGTFYHLEIAEISGYVHEIHRVLSPTGTALLQYGDIGLTNDQVPTGYSGTSQNEITRLFGEARFRVINEQLGRTGRIVELAKWRVS